MIQGNMANIEYICTTTYCACMLCLKGYYNIRESAGQILCVPTLICDNKFKVSIKRFLKRNLAHVGMVQCMNALADKVQKQDMPCTQ